MRTPELPGGSNPESMNPTKDSKKLAVLMANCIVEEHALDIVERELEKGPANQDTHVLFRARRFLFSRR